MIVILKELNNKRFPNFYFIDAADIISFEDAHDINGDYQLKQFQDPEEIDLITCETKSGITCYMELVKYWNLRGLEDGI